MIEAFTAQAPIILLGCGHMGRALAKGWLSGGLSADALHIVDPSMPVDAFDRVPHRQFSPTVAALPDGIKAGAVVLAVKPQIINDVLPTLVGIINEGSLIISIAAGVTLEQMRRGLDGASAVFIRAMPNTPAAIGEGITGFTAGPDLSEVSMRTVQSLLAATGKAVWIESEKQMDAVTALSGSGPAYVFHMVECMAAAGVAAGLDERTAAELARQTVIGAGHLLAAEEGVAAEDLRRRVTSPGGTTAAALDVLTAQPGLSELMKKAVRAARDRGKELAG